MTIYDFEHVGTHADMYLFFLFLTVILQRWFVLQKPEVKFILILQRNLKQTAKSLMSVVPMGKIHLGFHGFATCVETSSFVKSMMNIFKMILIFVA